MMRGYLKNKFNFSLLFLVFIFFAGSGVFAQSERSSKTVIHDGDTIVLQAISLTNITLNIETVIKEINKITEDTKPDPKINSADSLYLVALEKLDEESRSIYDEDNASNRALEDASQQWNNYKKSLGEWQTLIAERSVLLSINTRITDNLLTTWELTLIDAKKEKAPQGIILNLRDVINKLQFLKNNLRTQILSIYSKQSKLTELALFIDESIKEIESQKKSIRGAFFKQDSPAIWNAYDSTFLVSMNKEIFVDSVNETSKALGIFYSANKDRFYIHLLVFILLIVLFYFLHNHAIKSEETDEQVIKAKGVLNNYIISALILGFLATIWVYPTRQLVVDDIFQLTLLVLLTFFLPKVTEKRILTVLYYSIILHLATQLQLFFPVKLLIVRLILFFELGLILIILKMFLDKKGVLYESIKNSKWSFIFFFIKLNIIGVVVSFIANVFGFVGLATLTNNIIINSIFDALIIFAGLLIVTNAVTLIFKSEYISVFYSIRKHREIILRSIIKYVTIFAVILFAKAVLELFGVYNTFIEWLTGLFLVSWEFGEISIDFGSVLTFILVIVVTFLLTKILRVLLEEEIFSRLKLPRGVPGAISMVVRYFIVGWGIVISINALGINLSDFGLMAGALGVGIGFGLQNIVFNFIAGLILAFERPIQVGDTIEAGTVEGTVTSIGVRSSTVLTFDGSEVIVPNGNLISNDVINWTLSDRRKRRDIFVGVEYGNDPHKVMEILRKAADGNVNVLQDPAPWILFEGFGDHSLNFRLRIWAPMDVGLTTKSQVTIAVYDGLNEAGITIPFPQQDLHVRSIEPEVEKIILQRNETKTVTKKTTKKD